MKTFSYDVLLSCWSDLHRCLDSLFFALDSLISQTKQQRNYSPYIALKTNQNSGFKEVQGNVDLKHTLKSYYLHLFSVSIGFGLYSLDESTFQQETWKISCDGSRSPTGRIGDFTLLFCGGSQRNEPYMQSLFLRYICFVAPFSVE